VGNYLGDRGRTADDHVCESPTLASTAAQRFPQRHWRSYGTDPLPTAQEALAEPFAAFPSWFLKITCDRCGKDSMLNEAHMSEHRRSTALCVLISRTRHDGCGGQAARAELLTGIEGASSRPVRRIVLIANPMLRPAAIRRR
jgi:hypothetical protein